MTDEAGQVTLSRGYTPFGVPRYAYGQATGTLGYAGEQRDAASGLTFLRARYLDPATGRFLTRDPYPAYATVPGTLHRYAYVGNPVFGQCPARGERRSRQPRRPLGPALAADDVLCEIRAPGVRPRGHSGGARACSDAHEPPYHGPQPGDAAAELRPGKRLLRPCGCVVAMGDEPVPPQL